MEARVDSEPQVPRYVTKINRVIRRLLGAGVPMGPNAMITVRGRKSGIERTTPVTLVAAGGRRWVQGAWGETDWVRNLRAAGEAKLRVGRRTESVEAVELSPDEAVAFFRDVLGPFVRRVPFSRWIAGSLLKSPEFLNDPQAAADRHPVFELHRAA